MNQIEVTIKRDISPEFIDAIFSAAFHDGIVYWCPQTEPFQVENLTVSAILFEDEEEDGETFVQHEIDTAKIIGAIKRIIEEDLVSSVIRKWIFESVVDNDTTNLDSECADCIFQIAVFGEIKYG